MTLHLSRSQHRTTTTMTTTTSPTLCTCRRSSVHSLHQRRAPTSLSAHAPAGRPAAAAVLSRAVSDSVSLAPAVVCK
jgi:hypothetical protein